MRSSGVHLFILLLSACSADSTIARDDGGSGSNVTTGGAAGGSDAGGGFGASGSGVAAGGAGGNSAGGSGAGGSGSGTGATGGSGGAASGGAGAGGSGGGPVTDACDWLPGAPTYALPFIENAAHSFLDVNCDLWIGSPYSGAVYRIEHSNQDTLHYEALLGSDRAHGLAYDRAAHRVYAAAANSAGAKVLLLPPVSGPPTDLGVSGLPTIPNGMRVAPPSWGSLGGQLVIVFIDGTIAAVDPTTSAVTVIATTGSLLSGLVFDGGTLYVGDQTNQTVVTVSPSGSVATFAALPCATSGLDVDAGQRLFAGCAFETEIYQIALANGAVSLVGSVGRALGWYPRFLQWDGVDSLMYADGEVFWFDTFEL